jgi:hypothetical protein
MSIYQGMPVVLSNLLPVRVSYPATDIQTRKEVRISSDEFINSFEMNGTLYVDQITYDNIKNLPPNKTVTN